MRQVVITGAGVCCNLGDELDGIESALRYGRGGTFGHYAPAIEYHCRCRLVGSYDGDVSDGALEITKAEGRFFGRASRMALRAARSALHMAALERRDIAVVVGSGTGDVEAHLAIQRRLEQFGDAKRVLPTFIPRLMGSSVSANLVNVLRTTGPSCTVTAACAGGAYNIAMAAMLIQGGHVEAAVTGGAECADPHFYSGFDAMRAFNEIDNDDPHRASRPYAADRAGFVFGEGSGVLVLESRDHAEARGAQILGVLRGYGMSSDGDGEMVSPSREGTVVAMQRALHHAGIAASELDYVNTHGTSTPRGDVQEVDAIRTLLDERPVLYSSTKGFTGHTVSAAGAIEAVFTLLMLRDGWVAPSINADPLDPALVDYPPVRSPTALGLRTALSNSLGFGGTNVSLVLGSAP